MKKLQGIPTARAGVDSSGRGGEHVAEVGARGVHACDHVGIKSNTWQAENRARWEADLGQQQADLDLGPKTKFEAHMIPFNFH
jgi:hypothetical protein